MGTPFQPASRRRGCEAKRLSALRSIANAGVASFAAFLALNVSAQTKPVELSVSSTLTATNNGADSAAGLEQRDLFLSIRPSVLISHSGSGLRVRGDFGVDLFGSKNDTQENEVLPFANAKAEATLVDRLLFLDAALDVRQIEQDLFASRVEQGSALNSQTASTASLSPYVAHELTPDLSFLARADLGWIDYSGQSDQDARTTRLDAKIVAKARPLGALLEVKSDKAEYPTFDANDWRLDTAVAGPTYSINSELVLGVVVGAERTSASGTSQTDRVRWGQCPLGTKLAHNLVVSAIRRFFGTGLNASITHRNPFLSMALRAVREPLLPTVAGVGARGSLPAFLDAILTSRYPDPAQRASLVSEMVSTRGLQTSLQGTAGSAGNYAQLGTGGEATIVLLGTRNTFSISAYQQTIRLLTRTDGGTQFPGAGDSDNKQSGATLGFNRRLTPNTSADLSARWSRIEGLSARAGEVTREQSIRLAAIHSTAPRTALSLGVQYRKSDTNVSGLASFDETSAFVGLAHRF